MKKILITGGSGLIGARLTDLLLKNGYVVHHLGRGEQTGATAKGVERFSWDIDAGKLDKNALDGVEAIVHLAGAGIADMKWTEERKREIIDSRVKGATLLFKALKSSQHDVKTFISASAVGYYGDCGDEVITEEHHKGQGFLADVCEAWEQGAKTMAGLNLREVRFRIGIVLADKGGALPQLTKTLPLGFATWFAKKNLYYPWVHIDDVCGIMLYAIENNHVHGPYNATAHHPLLMKELMQAIIAAKKAKAVLVPAPPLAIKIALGEMSELVLSSQRCSAERITGAGYRFKFDEIKNALEDIYPKA